MGLSKDSTGYGAVDMGLVIRKTNDSDKVVALGGNPNVGKSTVLAASVIWNGARQNGFSRRRGYSQTT